MMFWHHRSSQSPQKDGKAHERIHLSETSNTPATYWLPMVEKTIFVRKKSYKYSWRVKEAIKPIQSVHNHNAHANCLIHHHPLKRQRSRHPSGVRLRLSLGCLVDPHFLAAQDHPVRICRPNFKQSIFPSFPRGALALVLTIFTMHCT